MSFSSLLRPILILTFLSMSLFIPILIIDVPNNLNISSLKEEDRSIPFPDPKIENKKWMTQKADPQWIDCGVYVKSLCDFDFAKNSFFINFYIWWLSDDPNISPEKSVEITNAQVYNQLWSTKEQVSGKTRVKARYTATVNQRWDLTYFPFDRQKFSINLEDSLGNINNVGFIPIPKNSKLSPDINFVGWKVLHFDLIQTPHKYSTNFDSASEDDAIKSRLSIVIEIKRKGWPIFFTYFIGYILSTILCIIIFFIPKDFFRDTMILCLGAIFSGMGNKHQLKNIVTSISFDSLGGIVTICTFSVIILTLMNVVITYYFYNSDRQSLAKKINYSIFILWTLGYLIIMGLSIHTAIQS